MASVVQRAANGFKAQLLRQENAAIEEMVVHYKAFWQALQPELNAVLDEIRRDGSRPSPGQLLRRQRVISLLAQTEDEIRRLCELTGAVVSFRQRENVFLAQEHAELLARTSLPKGTDLFWTPLNPEQIEELVGVSRNGTPLSDIFREIAPDGAQRLQRALIEGVAAGEAPGTIARRIQTNLGGNLRRLLTIVKTEDMRAYRLSTHRAFHLNADVLEGWVWHASLSFSSCAACLAMHGSIHPLSETLESHPNCRCIPIPRVLGSEERIETGEEWFSRQSEATQRKTLAPAKYEAYRAGEIRLSDLIAVRQSKKWGITRSEGPLLR